MLDPSLRSACTGICNYGIETVAFLYVIRSTKQDLAKLTEQANIDKGIVELRATLKPTNVVLTDEMEQCISQWSNGTKLAEIKDKKA